jgi:butyrate kinase
MEMQQMEEYMAQKILVLNPGSTSTKIAVYEGETQRFLRCFDHSDTDLTQFDDVLDQQDYRMKVIEQAIREWGLDRKELATVIGRGNLLPNMTGGGYLVEENMLQALKAGKASPHASNLGALLAWHIAQPLGIPAYIYDSVTADEFEEIAKITGMPGVRRQSMCHVLNMKAVSRAVAKSRGTTYETLNLIVAHMGGGITIGVHYKGRIIDAISDDSGPFSPERAGSIPLLNVIDMCYSGTYSRKEMIKFIRGSGGMKSFLGTADCREIEKMIDEGDEEARQLYEAQAYQVAKGIGQLAPVLNGKVDYIILTGGMAHSTRMTEMITERVRFIGPVLTVPGENEMESLALGALRLLDGEPYHVYEMEAENDC